ncbi:MAG: CheR family methyltransferase, partial [Vicinamibacteria bacterium]
FRNRPQFDFLESVVMPGLAEEKRSRGDYSFRVWSAGCSTGEEPYSIAISAIEALTPRSAWEIRIYASDLSLSALERADLGVYADAKLNGIGFERQQRYFASVASGFRVREEVKRLVIYDFHNLKHENGLGGLDVVFCRNVLIYFDPEEQQRVIRKLVRALKPGGYLFLGHSESVHDKAEDLKFVHHGRGTAYRKVTP